ncbi:hypothetical protein HDU76_012951 [Blyttiomyces sp. JEL0837]|nr:hypothetical protein HDU76_012951 [Blyttiomyces sp. JEL0837]
MAAKLLAALDKKLYMIDLPKKKDAPLSSTILKTSNSNAVRRCILRDFWERMNYDDDKARLDWFMMTESERGLKLLDRRLVLWRLLPGWDIYTKRRSDNALESTMDENAFAIHELFMLVGPKLYRTERRSSHACLNLIGGLISNTTLPSPARQKLERIRTLQYTGCSIVGRASRAEANYNNKGNVGRLPQSHSHQFNKPTTKSNTEAEDGRKIIDRIRSASKISVQEIKDPANSVPPFARVQSFSNTTSSPSVTNTRNFTMLSHSNSTSAARTFAPAMNGARSANSMSVGNSRSEITGTPTKVNTNDAASTKTVPEHFPVPVQNFKPPSQLRTNILMIRNLPAWNDRELSGVLSKLKGYEQHVASKGIMGIEYFVRFADIKRALMSFQDTKLRESLGEGIWVCWRVF